MTTFDVEKLSYSELRDYRENINITLDTFQLANGGVFPTDNPILPKLYERRAELQKELDRRSKEFADQQWAAENA